MCIKIKLSKSSKCRHCVGVLGSNPESSPVVSQSPININERSAVKGSAGDDGKEERDFISPFTFPSSPSHQCLMVSRNRSLTAYRIIRDVGNELVVKSSWSHTQLRGLIPIFQRTGTVFLRYDNSLPGNLSFWINRYSALLFKLNETAFFFGDKYCCYVNLALNLTVSSWTSRIKTIGRSC